MSTLSLCERLNQATKFAIENVKPEQRFYNDLDAQCMAAAYKGYYATQILLRKSEIVKAKEHLEAQKCSVGVLKRFYKRENDWIEEHILDVSWL